MKRTFAALRFCTTTRQSLTVSDETTTRPRLPAEMSASTEEALRLLGATRRASLASFVGDLGLLFVGSVRGCRRVLGAADGVRARRARAALLRRPRGSRLIIRGARRPTSNPVGS